LRYKLKAPRLLSPILLAGLICVSSGAQFLPISAATPNEEASVAELIAQARTSLDHGDIEGERASLERVLTLAPAHKQARLALIQAFMQLGRWKDAKSQAHVLLTQFPADTEPVLLLAIISMRQGDPQTAKELATRCLEHGDSRPEVYKVLALSEYLLQDTSQFETHIEAVLEKNPHDAEAQYFLARYLFEIKQYSKSLKVFQLVLQLDPDHHKAHYYAGLLHTAAGEPDLARTEFLASIKVIETKKIAYAWPFADLGRALNDEGEADQAIKPEFRN
jgi:tetratricopeptide (TPR) repeat protein